MSTSYRADQLGSLLRPKKLLEARAALAAGTLDAEALKMVEDEAIIDALAHQQAAGVEIFSDGEFRRGIFTDGLTSNVTGFVAAPQLKMPWHGGEESTPESAPGVAITARMTATGRMFEEEAAFLREHSPGPFKITLATPVNFGFFAWRKGLSESAYPTHADFIVDAGRLLADEVRQLSDDGISYLQLDSPAYTRWVDEELKTGLEASGVDMDATLTAAVAADNEILDATGDGIVTGVHLCRGNSIGRWTAQGGYDALAEQLFSELRCDRLLLEYDTDRAGDFSPLRFVPSDKTVVLGLVTTKSGRLESREELLAGIDEATAYLPIERLALSPQCGFASVDRGNPLTEAEQWAKLELVRAVADEVWPGQ
jgi:5-methyltetrahydropteroyltriglutamate--homocysteine methyltransferase